MSKYKILIEPDPILRQKCEPIDIVDDELRTLMRGMLETMYKAPGIGLAAIQLGILKRVVVIDISKDSEKKNPLFLVNPEITFKSKKTSTFEEGCLSLPGQYAEIERPAECHLQYLDFHGKKKRSKQMACCQLVFSMRLTI